MPEQQCQKNKFNNLPLNFMSSRGLENLLYVCCVHKSQSFSALELFTTSQNRLNGFITAVEQYQHMLKVRVGILEQQHCQCCIYIKILLQSEKNRMYNDLKYAAICHFTRATANMHNIINVVLGYPLRNPGHNCVIVDPAAQYFWQNTPCSKKLGYICYSNVDEEHLQTQGKALLLFVQLCISDCVCSVMLFLFLLQLLRQAFV